MTVSRYFSEHKNEAEQDLLNDIVVETIQQRGYDFRYSPRAFVNEDTLFGEDGTSLFLNAGVIEMIIDSVDGFGGEGDFAARMGLDIRDEFTFIVSKTRFRETITRLHTSTARPTEGDLIIFSLGKVSNNATANWHVFEITFVETEKEFYSLGSNYTYEISAKRFEYSHESMDTGISDIDDIEDFIVDQDNTVIQDEADLIVDFSEEDPFSDGDY